LELQQIGLIDFWDTWFRPMPPQCDGKPQNGKGKNKKKLSPLSLKNLTGAFIVLLVGLTFSLFVFLGEHIVALSTRHRSFRTTKSQQDPNNFIQIHSISTEMTEKEEEL
jgi:ionotropic glutamate receptor